jgi:predicted lipid-binding transport protein (Tim44 family)
VGEKPAQQPSRQPAAAGRAARRPRFGAWIGTGAAAGVVVALLLTLSAAPAGGYTRNQVALYLVLVLGSAGALLFGVAAAVLDARADRRDPAGAGAAQQPEQPQQPAAGEAPETEDRAERRAEQTELEAEERSAGGRPPVA